MGSEKLVKFNKYYINIRFTDYLRMERTEGLIQRRKQPKPENEVENQAEKVSHT